MAVTAQKQHGLTKSYKGISEIFLGFLTWFNRSILVKGGSWQAAMT